MSDDGLLRLYQQFGELKVTTEQSYQQVLEHMKQKFAEQQQTIARLTSRLEQIEAKHTQRVE